MYMKNKKEILLFMVASLLWIDIFLFLNPTPKTNLVVIIPVSFILALLPILLKKKIVQWYKLLFMKSNKASGHGQA